MCRSTCRFTRAICVCIRSTIGMLHEIAGKNPKMYVALESKL
jgi:hypothetical protein